MRARAAVAVTIAVASSGFVAGACHLATGLDDAVYDLPPGLVRYDDGKGGALFIDPREVTVEAYAAWLATDPKPALSASCAWNTSLVPADMKPNVEGASDCEKNGFDWETAKTDAPRMPVTCVDWCDAFAYCAAHGQELCGSIDGGGVAVLYDDATQAFSIANPNSSAWYLACSHGGERVYPYGDDFDASACDVDRGQPMEAGASPRCVGGYPGLFDMSGNVEEWENACLDGSDNALCIRRGGAFYSAQVYDPTWATCAFALPGARQDMSSAIGFRCCFRP